MYDVEQVICIEEDKDLKKVGLELMFMTPQKCSSEDGITAVELAKLLEMPIDIVKKKLIILKEKEIVQVRGINPKYWKFDEYNFQRMDEDDEIFRLLCSFDDVDFDRYFQY
ncbi:hypothetical protein IJ818_01330 [bacterium]|nr:hypothetical protein [bacterium]